MQVSDLLERYLQPERLRGENRYNCTVCGGLQDAERRLRLLDPPPYLVFSLVPFVVDRRSGARRKLLTPMGLTEELGVPVDGLGAVEYRLYSVIFHAGPSLDAGHYFSVCRKSDSAGEPWHRLDDASVTFISSETTLGCKRSGTETAYTLLYRRLDAVAEAPPQSAWQELPAALRAAVAADNEAYRRERRAP